MKTREIIFDNLKVEVDWVTSISHYSIVLNKI